MKNRTIKIKGELIDLQKPLVMGILNVTPDSFYAESRVVSDVEIIERVSQMMEEGADLVDVGCQSSNPQSPFLSEQEEWDRAQHVLSIIRKEFPDILISIDTFYASIAQKAVLDYGVNIINDISGGQIDTRMFDIVAQLNVPYILMHMKGTPQTMQQETNYKNLIQDIFYYFSEKVAKLNQLGVNDIILDPGFGFAKTLEQNYELMGALRGFEIFDLPLLVGVSRKSMIYKFLDLDPENSLSGTNILNTYALMNGANILRVHDVKEAKDMVKIMAKIEEYSL